jgi:peroxiredoxin
MMVLPYEWLTSRWKWLAVMSSVLILGVGWIALTAVPASATTSGRIPSPRAGFLAPDFTLGALRGGEISLAELRGQSVVLNLWASWCPPCRAEMPALQNAYERYRGRGLEIIALNTTYQDNESAAAEFARELGLEFPILLDRTGLVSNLYHLRALPTTFFIDREGVIQKVIIGGPMSAASIAAEIETLLAGGH